MPCSLRVFRYHSVGLKVEENKNKIRVGMQSDGKDGREFKSKANLKSCVLSLERVSGGREFQSRS